MDAPPQHPLVSIVVPAYKVEAYLPRCLDSILAQTYPHLEIIVVDDGSPDGCGDIMRDYAARDPRFRLISQDNAGLGAARNAAIAVATGDYLCMIDSDDYVRPDYVGEMVQLAQRRGADVVICNFYFELPSGVRIPFPLMTARRNLTGDEAGQRVLDLLAIPTFAWNKLYRRELFTEAGITFPSIYYEDVATIARVIAGAERVAITHKPLYHYCLRSGGITGNFTGRNVRDYLRAVDMVRTFIWDEGLWHQWRHPYRGFLRHVATQLVVSIQSRNDLPMRARLRASRMVVREIGRLREPPATSRRGPDHGLDMDAEIVFHDIVPRAQKPSRAAGRRRPALGHGALGTLTGRHRARTRAASQGAAPTGRTPSA